MAPPVDPNSSPPASPTAVFIGEFDAAFRKETSPSIGSDYESETTSTSNSSDQISSTAPSHLRATDSLQNSPSDFGSAPRSTELDPWSNSSESPHLGFAPLESATPTIPSSTGATAADTAMQPSMPPKSKEVDPPESQSEDSDDTESEPISAKMLRKMCSQLIKQVTVQLTAQHTEAVNSLADTIDALEGQVSELVVTVSSLKEQLKAKDENIAKERREFERQTTAAAEEYTREKEATAKEYAKEMAELRAVFSQYKEQYDSDKATAAQEKANTAKEKADAAEEYARYKEATARERLATAEEYARDKAATADAHQQEKKLREEEYSFVIDEINSMKLWICSPEKGALTAIHSRTITNDAMRSLCRTLKLPTYAGCTNGPAVFREWLDRGVDKRRAADRAAKFTGKGSAQRSAESGLEDDDDSIRKKLLKAALSNSIQGPHSHQPHHLQGLKKQAPTLDALLSLYECEEALDVLTQKNNIIREEGNYAAHTLNLNSLEQFTLQLEQPEGRPHMTEASVKAMQVLAQLLQAYAGQFKPEMPPAGSTIWTSRSTASAPPASAPPASAPPASVPPASVPPVSVSSSHPQAPAFRSGGSGSAKRTSRSNKGR